MASSKDLVTITADPRVLKRIEVYGEPIAPLTTCTWKRKPAVLAFMPAGVLLTSSGIASLPWWADYADLHLEGPGTTRNLVFFGQRERVVFASIEAADAFAEYLEHLQWWAAGHDEAGPLRLGTDERLVAQCTYLGGAFLPLQIRGVYDLAVRSDALEIYVPPATNGSTPLHTFSYGPAMTVEIGGPGMVTQGGGFIGGGFGLLGAAEGMLIGSVLNSLTTSTSITTIITIADEGAEGFFLNTAMTPGDLRRYLSAMFVRLRHYHIPQAPPALTPATPDESNIGDDLISQLERLSTLHTAGALTTEEFVAAKAAVLGQS